MLKILIPILGFDPGGGVRVLTQLANTWVQAGHRCVFLVPEGSRSPYFPVGAEIQYATSVGVSDTCTTCTSKLPALMLLYRGLREVSSQFDIVLANHSLTSWAVWLASDARVKKFYYIQAYEPDYYPWTRMPVKKMMARLSYLLPFEQLTNSDTYRAHGIKPLAVIPPGIDLEVFTPKPNQGPAEWSKVVLGTVGRKEPFKGTRFAMEAFRLLRQANSTCTIRVALGNVDPEEGIEIVPIASDRELAQFYRSVDILLVACVGQHAAPHYPLIEAMASCTPVVHTGFFPGNEENSYVAVPSDAASIAAKVMEVLQDQRYAEKVAAARAFVEDHLQWETIANKFIEVFSTSTRSARHSR